jgi:hypothetical protein
VLAIVTYSIYLVVVLGLPGPIDDRPYIAPLLWTIGGSIVASIVLHIFIGMFSPRTKDQRDREIARQGDLGGQSFLVIGALGAMVLAMAEFDTFWIANALYLGFVLSAILGSIIKIGLYRFGMHA